MSNATHDLNVLSTTIAIEQMATKSSLSVTNQITPDFVEKIKVIRQENVLLALK